MSALDFDLDDISELVSTDQIVKAPRILLEASIASLSGCAKTESRIKNMNANKAGVLIDNEAYRQAAEIWIFRDGILSRPESPSVTRMARCNAFITKYFLVEVLKMKIVCEAEKRGGAEPSASQTASG